MLCDALEVRSEESHCRQPDHTLGPVSEGRKNKLMWLDQSAFFEPDRNRYVAA